MSQPNIEQKARRTTRIVLTALTMLVAWTVVATAVAVLRGVAEHHRAQQTEQLP